MLSVVILNVVMLSVLAPQVGVSSDITYVTDKLCNSISSII
jgi:hypothetical protein